MATGESLEIYETLGWELQKDGSQLVCDCPFCGKRKMYVDPSRAVFDCKVCGTSGNNVTVLEKMHQKVWRTAMNPARYKLLGEYRHMPDTMFIGDELVGYDVDERRYVFIVRKPNGMPMGLRTWKPDSDLTRKVAVHNLKGCKLGLLGGELLGAAHRKTETVYLCEGEWDRFAMAYMLGELATAGIVLSVPGANNFANDWIEWFRNRDVVVLYDNDDPGRMGSSKVYTKLARTAARLRFLHWDQSKKDGYDVHDLVRENLLDLDKAKVYINSNLRTDPTGAVASAATGLLSESTDRQKEQDEIEPITVDELHETFQRWLLLDNCDLLDTVMGCMWSVYLPGNPLWLFVVAPPSGSKSETIMPASEWWRCHAVSNMTARSLVSGFQLPGGEDPSLLASLKGKRAVIAVKDLTPLLQASQDERDEVFGILRDAYDGSLSKIFGNGIKRTYTELHFVLIAGVTPAIDAYNGTSMGERFLKFRSDHDTERDDDLERAIRAIENCGNETQMRDALKAACVGALQREFDETKIVQPSREFTRLASELALLTANIRAVAPTERGSELQTMAPLVEAPPRLATQFVKFAQGLALHLEATDLMDPRVVRLVRRVALHTPDVITTRIVQTFATCLPERGMSSKEVAALLTTISSETIMSVARRMIRTGFMEEVKVEGSDTLRRIKPKFLHLIEHVRFFDDLPRNDPLYNRPKPPVKTPLAQPITKTTLRIKKSTT